MVYITKNDFNNLVAAKLGDVAKVHWTSDEIDLYINEALSTFNVISQFWKSRLFLTTTIDKSNYDLYSDLDNASKPFISHANYNDVIDIINYQLIESISVLSPTSALYDLEDINKYIDRRLDLFLTQTGLNISIITIPIQAGIYEYRLPNYVLDIIRLAIKDDNNVYRLIEKEDEADLGYFDCEYRQSVEDVKYYSRLLEPNNLIRLYPIPKNNSELQVICIKTRDKDLNISITNNRITELILLPYDLFVYIKWGVLADLLNQEGLGKDIYRAKYCLQRWNEGLIIGKAFTSILNAYVNELPLLLDNLVDEDAFNVDWQNTSQTLDVNNVSTDNIDRLLLAGYNIFFTNKIPKAIEQITLDCVVNAPIDSDDIELKDEYLNIISDYIIHLANFKEGYAAIQGTMDLMNNFLNVSINYNLRLKQQGITFEYLLKKTKIQEEQNNRGVEMAANIEQ